MSDVSSYAECKTNNINAKFDRNAGFHKNSTKSWYHKKKTA